MLADLDYLGLPVFGNTTWELVQAFSKTMDEQAARNQQYFLPAVIILLLLITAYILWSKNFRKTPPVKEVTVYELANSAKPISPTKNDQNREWVRVPVNINLAYALVKTGLPGERLDYLPAVSIDLSGGGMSISSRQPLKEGDILKIKFELDPGKELNLTGRLARSVVESGPESRRWIAGIEFMGIAARDTEYIIQWIFKNQRDHITRDF